MSASTPGRRHHRLAARYAWFTKRPRPAAAVPYDLECAGEVLLETVESSHGCRTGTARALMDLVCMNCLEPVTGTAGTRSRGPDIAWCVSCRQCAELVRDQMELVSDRPSGAAIQLYRCRICGVERACRPNWRTRCHVCLDDRSASKHEGMDLGRQLFIKLQRDQAFTTVVRRSLGLRSEEAITVRSLAEFAAALNLEDDLEAYRRPGWTVLAGDVHGLPWPGKRWQQHSHGTWGRHDICGHVQKLTKRRVECALCPPEPDSRTHRARKDDPYLLYLVAHGRTQKFGRGYAERVMAHIRAGARVIQVLTARHQDVVAAENTLKRQYRTRIVLPDTTSMLTTFGIGTEVVPRRVRIDLTSVLPQGQDVTSRFSNRGLS